MTLLLDVVGLFLFPWQVPTTVRCFYGIDLHMRVAARRENIKKKDHAVRRFAPLGWILGPVFFEPVQGCGLVASS